MLRFLVRLVRSADEPRSREGRSFAPRLESLDGRAVPSVLLVGAADAAVGQFRAASSGAEAPLQLIGRNAGEEIPSDPGAPIEASAVGLIPNIRLSGEELPQ